MLTEKRTMWEVRQTYVDMYAHLERLYKSKGKDDTKNPLVALASTDKRTLEESQTALRPSQTAVHVRLLNEKKAGPVGINPPAYHLCQGGLKNQRRRWLWKKDVDCSSLMPFLRNWWQSWC